MPSINTVSLDDLGDLVEQLRDSMNAFMQDPNPPRNAQDPGDDAAEAEDHGHRWTERQFDALYMLNQLEALSYGETASGASDLIYSCMLGLAPVGLIHLKNFEDMIEIRLLVSHPGVAGAGEILLEKAVNESDQQGHNGAIYLSAMMSAVPFYQSAGLTLVEPGSTSMVLLPSISDKWLRVGGRWRLARRVTKADLVLDETESQPAAGSA
jgi:hypothetical protein